MKEDSPIKPFSEGEKFFYKYCGSVIAIMIVVILIIAVIKF